MASTTSSLEELCSSDLSQRHLDSTPTASPELLHPCLEMGTWAGCAPAVVLASGPPLHAFSHKLLLGTPFVPGIMPGA